jgi:hypothetical protein
MVNAIVRAGALPASAWRFVNLYQRRLATSAGADRCALEALAVARSALPMLFDIVVAA